jgi:hypothetical protein
MAVVNIGQIERASQGRVGNALGFSRPSAPTPPRDNLVMRNSPRAAQAPATSTGSSRNIAAPEAPTVTQPAASPGRINWRDSAFNSQIAAIQRALQDFETGAQTRGERYGQDFSTGLGRLGYRPAAGFQAMPNILEQLDQPQAMSAMSAIEGEEGALPTVSLPPVAGAFDIEGQFDPYSTAARGTRGVRDEFAGRGTLRSSDFARNFGEFQSRLNDQLLAMETARGRFGQDLASEVAQERTRAQEQQEAARRDAIMRAAVASAQAGGF